MEQSKKNTEVLHEVLKGEIAATETYRQVLEKLDDDANRNFVNKIYDDHEGAVSQLKLHAAIHGETPLKESGAWGTFAQAYTGAAKIFGDKAALGALESGEEHGLTQYQDALNDESVDPLCKADIRNTFIPQQKNHIQSLDSLISGLGN
jgi:uncharacterized protein (TIGR02284 family)